MPEKLKTPLKKTVRKKTDKKSETVLTSKKYTNMFQAYKAFWKRGFTEWKGTSSRSEYWWTSLMNAIIRILLALIQVVAVGPDIDNPANPLLFMVAFFAMAVFAFALIVPTVSLQLRRFHDAGIKSWIFWVLFVLDFVLVYAFDLGIVGLVFFVVSLLPTKEKDNPYHAFNK